MIQSEFQGQQHVTGSNQSPNEDEVDRQELKEPSIRTNQDSAINFSAENHHEQRLPSSQEQTSLNHHQEDGPNQPSLNHQESHPIPPHLTNSWSSRFKRCLAAISTIKRLENKSSVARDHLANERTFLAWFRTSLSLTSIGIALTQLSRIPKQTEVQPVAEFLRSLPRIMKHVDAQLLEQQQCNDSNDQNLCNLLAAHDGPLKSILDQINQNLINLDSTLNRSHHIHSVNQSKNFAGLIGKSYVCLGLVFLFVEHVHRYI